MFCSCGTCSALRLTSLHPKSKGYSAMSNTLPSLWKQLAPGQKISVTPTRDGVPLSATFLRGTRPGKRVLLTAGIHGCEYCSIQAAIELAAQWRPEEICGSLAIVPIANPSGFAERLPAVVAEDGKNLNRVFPGKADGSSAERLAHILTELQDMADFYIDMHGGDLHESMHPFVYIPGVAAEAVTEAARAAARTLDVEERVLSSATTGAYNAAALRGVPSLLIERGGNGRWSREEVEAYKRDIRSLLRHLGLLEAGDATPPADRQREIRDPVYLEAEQHGCWYPTVTAGAHVRAGDLLGELRDAFGSPLRPYHAERNGRVLYFTVSLAVKAGTPLVAYG